MAHKPVRIDNRRKVSIDTDGLRRELRPVLHTAAGRSPIAVSHVELRYDIDTGALTAIEARGDYLEQRDIDRRARNTRAGPAVVTRRVPISWHTHQPQGDVPQWLRDMIEKYRP